jgi:trimeric autotransporter adhesin
MGRRPLILVCAIAAVASVTVGITESAAAGPVVVNSTGDGDWDGNPGACETATGNGVCTLRAAFAVANTATGTVIDFAVPGPGVHSITPGSALPALWLPVTIDGTSQPGYTGVPLIEVSGASAPDDQGIILNGGDSAVRGLVVDRWGEQGILIQSDGNTIAGNYLGIAPDGQSPAGNGRAGHGGEGLLILGASRNTVGGIVAGDRNVISGNAGHGVQIQRPTPTGPEPATGNIVEGNYVGTNATGDAVVANGFDGISLVWGAQENTIGGSVPGARNVVSGNDRIGISVFDVSDRNLIEGNYVGTNAAGTAALGGNLECGITLISSSNMVGGTSAATRNVISGNGGGCGIDTGAGGSNTIQGNYIGTDAAGTAPLGNGTVPFDIQAGVSVQSPKNEIGGTDPGAGNVISGNVGPGVEFDTSTATNNFVRGNYIGGNSGNGVVLGGGTSNNAIGGTAAGAANTIAHNTLNGVAVWGGSGQTIEGNSIFANGGLGIALNPGTNGNLAAPAVLLAVSSDSSTTITGTAPTGRRVEVFANASCSDPEGAVFLGAVVSAANGLWSLAVPAVAIGNGITATATDPGTGNTSQFSACQVNRLQPPAITSIIPRSGSIRGGTKVRIVGQYLSATAVTFGHRAARFTVDSPTQISAVSPRGSAPGAVTVIVTAAGGPSAGSAADTFTYVACVVPKLRGKTLSNARKALKRADCRLGKVTARSKSSRVVRSQRPKAGRVLPPRARVQVTLGRPSSKPRR